MMQTRHAFKFFAIVLLATIGSPTAGEPTASEPIERARAVVENTTARRGELEYLMSQVQRAIVRLTEIEAQNEALRAKNAMLQWQLGEISDAHRALEKSSLAATREMQQQLAAVTEELKSERGVSGALVVKASALKQQLNKMTSARTTLENEFKSAEQRTKQQLNDLQLQLAALTVEMESERAVRDALARQGNTLTETVSALRRERSALNADLKSAHAAIDLGTSEIGRRQAEIVTLSNQVAAHRALEKSSLAATREMQQQLAAVTEELKSERGVSGALVVKASALKQQLNKMTSARTTLENEFKSAEQRTKQQLNDLQLQLAALTVEMESERAVRDALARQGNTLTETVSALRRERSALNADLKSAHAAIDLGTSEIGRRQAEIVTLSNQVAALRADLKEFKAALAQARIREAAQKENNDELGRRLNAALAGRVRELEKYRSEFFGRLQDVLGDQSDVRVVGDRFVLQSEILFASGSARIGKSGTRKLAQLAVVIKQLAALIPADVDWILRVDGHTDRVPIVTEHFSSNWELSTARAVSVVEFLVGLGIAPTRLAATGFGEFQPIDDRGDEIAYRRNRRIEFKLTQR